ncbi:CaiB/BaiF CoA-transferase family protein [Paenibacillus sp. BSR1-1]|uniref:CaiB/BaiF CoA transferase family protein n=1 Tax=Paenibacillus sp. BSR1-1 TaxID=3020845 RepID=UPI0025AFF2BF|nr:CaiB/BaiF CoA-transferase family protein [Paenibacillus sp. BSR1-1]MDN3016175.1 CaiB/BaiF CoA-transferase family protein [Paenibacillus sp. BSR1-1]
MSKTVLEGLRILNLAEQYPGPYATLILSDLGADVINIERPNGGDPSRQFKAFYESLNRNKRSLAVDLKCEKGKKVFFDLARNADVIIEGYRPGVAKKLGISYEEVFAVNEQIVYASVTGFGQEGPYKSRPAHDISYQAISGMLYKQADNGIPSLFSKLTIGDLSSGMFTVIGILSALLLRNQAGKGSYVDISMTDGLVSWMTTDLFAVINNLGKPGLPDEPGFEIYRTQDGKLISLSIAHEDWFWADFCHKAGLKQFSMLKGEERRTRFSELKEIVAQAISTKTQKEWEEIFGNSIPYGSVLSLDEVPNDPQIKHRKMFVEVPPLGGHPSRTHIRQPLQFRGYQTLPKRHSPKLGENSREILSSIGYSEDEIEHLLINKICYEEPSK